jgi:protein-S-isoprenylcysteine O-methyltransferase Ste14
MRSALARIPPPLLFVVCFLLGLRIDGSYRFPLTSATWDWARSFAGSALAVLGAAMALSAIALFARRRTTIVPFQKASSLVTSGPFRLSRNPMYVASFCVYVGVSVVVNSFWPLVLLALPIAFLRGIVIPLEERHMGEVFGREYRDYAARVRRWL